MARGVAHMFVHKRVEGMYGRDLPAVRYQVAEEEHRAHRHLARDPAVGLVPAVHAQTAAGVVHVDLHIPAGLNGFCPVIVLAPLSVPLIVNADPPSISSTKRNNPSCLTHHVPPVQQLCRAVFPVKWPRRMTWWFVRAFVYTGCVRRRKGGQGTNQFNFQHIQREKQAGMDT